MIIAAALSLVFLLAVLSVRDSVLETVRESRQETYGRWTGAVYHAGEVWADALAAHESVEQLGKMKLYGTITGRDGREAGGIGTIDAQTRALGKIRMKEGRFPERENEIALEEKLFKRLGISYEEGKEISLDLYKDGKRTYTLCGMIMDYSSYWQKADFNLASAVIAEPEHGDVKETHLFFYGKRYEDLSELEELDVFKQPLDGSRLIGNKMAYESTDAGLAELLESKLLAVLPTAAGMCIIFYIQFMQFQQRRNSLVTLRGIGASKGQILALLLWEDCYILIRALPFGAAVGVLFPYLVLKMTGFHTVFRWKVLIYAVLAASAAFFAGTFLLYASVRKLSVTASFRTESTAAKRRKFPKIKKVISLSPWKIFRRRRYFSEKQTIFRNAVLLFGSIFVAGACIGASAAFDFRQNLKQSGDADYEWWGKKYGIMFADIEKLQNMDGIREIKIKYGNREDDGWDEHRRISWEGFRESRYIKERNLIVRDWIPSENIEVTDDFSEELWKYYASCMTGRLDKQAFLRGNEVVLVLPSYVEKGGRIVEVLQSELPYVKRLVREETIQPGDRLRVTRNGGFDRTVTVGAVIRSWKEKEPRQEQMAWKAGDLIVSPEFEKFGKPEENIAYEALYNDRVGGYLFAKAETGANTAELDERLAGLMEERLNPFTNHRKEREKKMKEQLSLSLLCAGLAAVIFLIVFIILLNGQQIRLQNEKRQNTILHFLGMDRTKFRKLYLAEAAAESVRAFAIGMFIIFAVWGCVTYAVTAADTFRGIVLAAAADFPWKMTVAAELFYFAAYIAVTYSLIKRSEKWESS